MTKFNVRLSANCDGGKTEAAALRNAVADLYPDAEIDVDIQQGVYPIRVHVERDGVKIYEADRAYPTMSRVSFAPDSGLSFRAGLVP